MPYIFILLFSSLFLVMFKLANLSIRLSDTNVYFYTAYQLLHGNVLYKDIFFTNFPLFPYISALYIWVSGGSLEFYYITPVLEAIATAVVLFCILKKQFSDELTAFLGGTVYLFSFILLSTSDHQTGVFFLSLLGALAYYFFILKRPFFAGIFLGLALCVKAYFLPVAAAFFLYTVLKERQSILKMIGGAALAGAAIFLPTLLLSFPEFWKSVEYSLSRSQGLDKLNILFFFMKHDLLLFTAFICSLSFYKKQLLLFLISVFSVIFILFYQDLYYLYLNLLVPYLVISAGYLYYEYLSKNELLKKGSIVVVLLLACINSYWYISSYSQIGKVSDFNGIVQAVKKAKPSFIYGEEGLVTAVAYKTGVPMLAGLTDTNANIFRKGVLNAKNLTHQAVTSRTVIISDGAEYPQTQVDLPILSEIMQKDIILKKCKEIFSSPVDAEGSQNRVNVFRCY